MAKEQHFINNVKIKNPTDLQIERFKVTNLERLANTDMAGDLLGKKKKFIYRYSAITNTELNTILDVLWETNEIFYTLKIQEGEQLNTYVVYPGSIPSDLYRDGGEWVWENVSFSLIQR